MKPITLEWIEKAEADFVAAQREYRARKNPLYDISCFHAQQCAEKYLKAKLEEHTIVFSKTHDLLVLLEMLLPLEPTWFILQEDMSILTGFAVAFRYPGISATKAMAKDVLQRCQRVRQSVRESFGLSLP